VRKINVRPIRDEDVEALDRWRWLYTDGDLEIVHGWGADGVETAVGEKDGKMLGSLTASKGVVAVICDPFIHDPDADHRDVMAALLTMERVLAYRGMQAGAVDAYVAVPSHLTEYIKIVEKCGYEVTTQNCTILRRPLVPETHKRLGPARDAVLAEVDSEVNS